MRPIFETTKDNKQEVQTSNLKPHQHPSIKNMEKIV